jgi:predicted protein tyrosine phosphatase
MNYIDNVPMAAIEYAEHYDCGPNSMLIQILDPCMEFPVPKYKFKEIYQFEFLDIGDDDKDFSDFEITVEQSVRIVNLLKHALENRMNVVCHCHAGIARSGAVVEVATMMGFQDFGSFRIPNSRVKRLMMKELGLTYDATNEIYEIIRNNLNGEIIVVEKRSEQ